MHTLVGYTDQPTLMELVVYIASLLLTVGLMKSIESPRVARAAT